MPVTQPPPAPLIRPANAGDFTAVARLLHAHALPLEGVPADLGDFLVAESDGDLVGVVGLERYAAHALLRSAAVAPAWQGTGVGRRLVDAIIARAAQGGARQLWLLTTTAERWFPRFGFVAASRLEVPDAMKASREFQGACPDTAVIMRRTL